LGEADAALGLARALGLEQLAHERRDGAAARAPVCGPQREERRVAAGGEELERLELFGGADAVGAAGSASASVGGEAEEDRLDGVEERIYLV
ncbi:MAG: hypothetical protein INR71_13905, partial [Terriglobus roseus]|nr:hypothetical protein [Terriglobus roseus]